MQVINHVHTLKRAFLQMILSVFSYIVFHTIRAFIEVGLSILPKTSDTDKFNISANDISLFLNITLQIIFYQSFS